MTIWVTSALETADAIFAALANDKAATAAYTALSQAGGTVYAVGGAVRDAMLGKPPKDVDLLVTGLTPDTVNQVLDGLPGRVDLTGKAFGVFRYREFSGGDVEIALPRSEQSTGLGHKDFEVSVNHNMPVEDDLYRRDFTANAMAINLENGELIDPYGGEQDIADRNLALVNPEAFNDDPLRTVRALVAQARHGLQPTPELLDALRKSAPKIRYLPGERIQAELDKLITAPNPVEALELAHESGLLSYLLPEVDVAFDFDQRNPNHDLDVGRHLLAVLNQAAHLSSDADLRMAALLHDIGKPDTFWQDEGGKGHFYRSDDQEGSEDHEVLGAQYAEALLKRLRYPTDRIDHVVKLIRYHMFPKFNSLKGARKFLRNVGDPELAKELIYLRQADIAGKKDQDTVDVSDAIEMRQLLEQAMQEQSVFSLKDLQINGKDLLDLGIPAGPEIGKMLHQLLDMVVERPDINQKGMLVDIARGLAR